jgi:hypothetical protein
MKKSLIFVLTVLWIIPAMPQEKTGGQHERSLLTLSAGVAVPIMCYASKDINDPFAGFAKPGFTIDISYDYRLSNTMGVAGTVFYTFNKTGSDVVSAVSSPGSYRVFGFLAGPVLFRNIADRLSGDIRLMAGLARAMTPELEQRDQTILNRHSAGSFAWKGGIGMRYELGGKTFLRLSSDYMDLKPKFKMKPGETGKNEQHIVQIMVDAGFGWKF